MLMKTDVIDRGTTPPQDSPARCVTGQFLAKNRRDARGRAHLAAGLVDGSVKVSNLTRRQAALLCRVCVPYVDDARRSATARESLAQCFARSTADERRKFARAVGVDRIWDELIQPLV